MLRAWILTILLSMSLFSTSGYAKEKGKLWKGAVTKEDLVVVVNFLMNNKGKEIELAGKKHTITGKEKLDVVITILPCCDERMFHKEISALGEVRNVKFPTFYVTVPADAIPKIDKHGEITDIKLESKAREFWMKAIKQ